MIYESRRNRVLQGIEMLSVRIQDWQAKINGGLLDLNHPRHCVLGQLYGTFQAGCEQLSLKRTDALDCGFAGNDDSDARHLEVFWVEFLNARR